METARTKRLSLSGSALKLIAVITMLIDHIASALLRSQPRVLFTLSGYTLTLYELMRRIGRLAFPIYCFLLVEGYRHSHDRRKYGRNLLLFALLSEIPWNLLHGNALFCGSQNVYFTLFLGYLGICALEKYRQEPSKQLFSVLGLLILSNYLQADYGIKGFALIMALYVLREQELPRVVVGAALLGYPLCSAIAFLPIHFYNGERGFIRKKWCKYAFYAFYPVHMLALWIIKRRTVGY